VRIYQDQDYYLQGKLNCREEAAKKGVYIARACLQQKPSPTFVQDSMSLSSITMKANHKENNCAIVHARENLPLHSELQTRLENAATSRISKRQMPWHGRESGHVRA